MRHIFVDPVNDHEIIRQGFVHYPLLSEAETRYLLDELRKTCPESDFKPRADEPSHKMIYSSYLQNELKLRQVADKLVREVLASHVERLLDRYRILSCGFFIKAPRGGELGLHSHWLVTESLKHAVVNIWCPLMETTVANGTFHAIPGSHQLFPEIIYFGYKPFYRDYCDVIKEQYSIPLPSLPGQAVIFHDSMLHWSPDNLTDSPRYAIHCTCIPLEAQSTYVYFDETRPQQFELYEADEEFFVQNGLTQDLPRPTGMKLLGTIPNRNRAYTFMEFKERMSDGEKIRSQLYLDDADEQSEKRTRPMRRVFNDSALQQHFIAAGYNQVPMLSKAEVASVLSAMRSMRPTDNFTPDVHVSGATYHCSFLDTNVAYKRQVHNLIQEVFSPYVAKYLAGYRIVNANFYVKPPHKGDFEVHQNWPILADLSDTSVTIWCPMQDTYPKNGTLQVVAGSHKIHPYVQGPTVPPYFDCFKGALFEKWLKPIPVAAGNAVIFDDGLIHWTARNDSDAPRIAIQILCVPKDKVPIYFFHDATCPDRFEVVEADVDFFIEQSISDIRTRQPDWKSLGYVDNHNRLLTEEEFGQLMLQGDDVRKTLYESA